ncbi:MAG: hypothetical protein ACOC49_04115, partial [Candidatus Bipolaricaulota bacterium]
MGNYEISPKVLSYDLDLSVETGKVSRYLKNSGRSAIEKYISDGIRQGNDLVEPRAIYAVARNSESLNKGYNLPKPLQESELLCFGISTIGSQLEDRVDQLMKEGDYTLSNVLDSVGSAAVDETSDRLGEELLGYAHERDLNTTRAFQPGSGASHWKVKNQKLIFEYLEPEEIGVKLTSSFTMSPKKSNSFAIG